MGVEANWRPTPADLAAIERDLEAPPPPPPEPEYINGAMRDLNGRFVSQHLPLLTEMVRNTSPFEALEAVVILRNKIEDLTRDAVTLARAHEWSWRDIGAMFGISASPAYRRYGR